MSAQTMKAMKRKDYREIRYDLIPELRRKRTLGDNGPFLEVVADFISAYNVENARRREMDKPAPANVTTEELAAFCRQVDDRGARLLGALLCAYGTCRDAQAGSQVAAEEDREEPLENQAGAEAAQAEEE